ncbi:MAG: hypothetical protein ACLRPN_11145 [Blautia massiliensis (ex Durand et al. 2017)]|uniref:hypothetical protein n=1 Tax=Blautia massiliensis (ex Durand et al. 2017) TaxID=1737424 RepID=UPI003990BE10
MIAASLSILNNSVVMDDGTDPGGFTMIQEGIEHCLLKDIQPKIDLLLDNKNSGLIDESSDHHAEELSETECLLEMNGEYL